MGRIKRTPTKDELTAFDEVVAILGGDLAVARAVGNLSKSAIQRWHRTGVPAERCADLERLSGIPRGRLRPDLFDLPDAA